MIGDEINALLACCGYNLRKSQKSLRAFLSPEAFMEILNYLNQEYRPFGLVKMAG